MNDDLTITQFTTILFNLLRKNNDNDEFRDLSNYFNNHSIIEVFDVDTIIKNNNSYCYYVYICYKSLSYNDIVDCYFSDKNLIKLQTSFNLSLLKSSPHDYKIIESYKFYNHDFEDFNGLTKFIFSNITEKVLVDIKYFK